MLPTINKNIIVDNKTKYCHCVVKEEHLLS